MKRKLKWIGIALLSAVLVFGLTGCPDPKDDPPPKKSDEALLTKVVIGADADTFNCTLGDVISDDTWEGFGALSTVAENYRGSVIVQNAAAYAKNVTLTVSKGASVSMARWASGQKPTSFEVFNGEAVASLTNGNGIAIMVESESGLVINYYIVIVTTRGANSTLQTLKIGDTTAVLGTPATGAAPSWDDVVTGSFTLNSSTKTGVLSYEAPRNVTYSSIEYGIGATLPTPLTPFTSVASATYEDETIFWVKVVSENGESTSLYKVEAEVGRVADVGTITINGLEALDIGVPASLASGGTLNATFWGGVGIGNFEPGVKVPSTGFPITITGKDPDATVSWIVATNNPSGTTAWGNPSSPNVSNTDFLFIRVVSANGKNNNYYKIGFTLQSSGEVVYGQPNIKDPAGLVKDYVDPLWTNATIFPAGSERIFDLSRLNTAEIANPSYMWLNPIDRPKTGHTRAIAKALWDDEGLYVYAEIDFVDYYANSAATTGTARVGGWNQTDTDNAHLGDSLEIFTNERYQIYKSYFDQNQAVPQNQRNIGNQFRVGVRTGTAADPNQQGGIVSGNGPATNPPVGNIVTLFRNSGNYNSWIRYGAANKEIGYTVVAKVPWTWIGHTDTSDLFDANGLVKASTDTPGVGPSIGMEFQLNTSLGGSTSSRDAILTWNGITTQSYQNATGYGVVSLVFAAGSNRIIKAAPPSITAQPPATLNFTQAELTGTTTKALTVTATGPTSPAAVLTYQWYRATTETGDGTAVSGASGSLTSGTAHSYKPVGAQEGEQWYYVVVTNTRADATEGYKTATVTSNRTKVTVTTATLPIFTTQPRSETYNAGGTARAMSVTIDPAASPDGTYSYQWWSATSETAAGAAISGATALTYTPIITSVGRTYYWIVVTNTPASGPAAVATSNRALVTVVAAGTPIDFVMVLTGTGPKGGQINAAPVASDYGRLQIVDLGADFDIRLYDKFTFEYAKYTGTTDNLTQVTTGVMQMKWRDTTSSICAAGGDWGWDLGTVPATGVQSNVPAWLHEVGNSIPVGSPLAPGQGQGTGPWAISALRYLDFETKTTPYANFLELTRITFHLKPGAGPGPDDGLVVNNPEFVLGSTATLNILNDDGSITLKTSGAGTSASGGSMAYRFQDGYKDYDYVTVHYEVTAYDEATANPPPGDPISCEIRSVQAAATSTGYSGTLFKDGVEGEGGEYLNLLAGTTIRYRIDGATGTTNVGFRWNCNAWNWDVAGRPSEFTVKVSKLVFTTVEKYTISFNAGYTGAPAVDPVIVLIGTPIGNLPAVSRTGWLFTGWYDGDTSISSTYVPTKNMTLTAKWAEIPTRAPINVTFTTANTAVVGTGSVDIIDGGTGYEYTYGGAYQASWVKLTLTLPTGALLGEYDKISFDVTGLAGDTGWKQYSVLAGTPLPASFSADPISGVYRVTTGNVQYTQGTQTIELTIDKVKAAGLTAGQPIEFSIYEQSNNASGGSQTKWKIENLVISQN